MNDPVKQLWRLELVLSVQDHAASRAGAGALLQSSGQDSVRRWIPFVGPKVEAWSRFRRRGRKQSVLETTSKENDWGWLTGHYPGEDFVGVCSFIHSFIHAALCAECWGTETNPPHPFPGEPLVSGRWGWARQAPSHMTINRPGSSDPHSWLTGCRDWAGGIVMPLLVTEQPGGWWQDRRDGKHEEHLEEHGEPRGSMCGACGIRGACQASWGSSGRTRKMGQMIHRRLQTRDRASETVRERWFWCPLEVHVERRVNNPDWAEALHLGAQATSSLCLEPGGG